MEKKLLLLDAFALIYRAYFAFAGKPMNNSRGFNTSAIFGFTKAMLEVIRKEKPTHIGVAFDLPVETFRHLMFPEYKANRQEAPEVIKESVPIIKELVEAFNIPLLAMPGYEADDVIGTLAKKAEQAGFVTYMMTPDKDYAQLVSDHIFIYKPGRFGYPDEKLGPQDVKERYGIEHPEQVIDILALWGDTSDNVPGAPGIGEKTAMKLIGQYGSIENLLAHTHELKGKQKESIEQSADLLARGKKLVTIDLDVPIELDIAALAIKDPNVEQLREIFTDLDFKSYLKEFCGGQAAGASAPKVPIQGDLFASLVSAPKPSQTANTVAATPAPAAELLPDTPAAPSHHAGNVEHHYHCLCSAHEVRALVQQLSTATTLCLDTETDNIDPIRAHIVGISLAVQPHEAWYITLDAEPALKQELLTLLRPLLQDTRIGKIGQNIKYDYLVLKREGIQLAGAMYDTMLAHYLLNPEGRHNMDDMACELLNYQPIAIESLLGAKGAKQLNMRDVPLEQLTEYAAEDADITLQLYHKLFPMLEQAGLMTLYTTMEAPLIEVLADMEWEGVSIDAHALKETEKVMTKELEALEAEIREMAGEPGLNVFSPKQLGEVLFDKMQIVSNARTTSKSKQYSTSEETLSAMRDKHPIVDKILELRSLKKLLSSYVETLPGLVNPETGRIHTSFNQAVTATGRLSSNNPNLQNIPIRDERGREIRKAFIPSGVGHTLLSADYSQVELRLMAHLSQDPNLMEAFLHNEDIHSATAAKIFHIPIAEVSKEQRRQAKTANFGIIYGISAHGLSQRLGISRGDAKTLIDGYFAAYPMVRKYMDDIVKRAQEQGYVSTLCGRKRMLPDINSRNAVVRGYAERNAINAPIQGSAADIIKLAMIKIHARLKAEGLQARMILQVHDELVLDVPQAELAQVQALVCTEMENAIQLSVPLLAEAGSGANWLVAH